MFPVDAGQDPETLRRHTFKIAKTLAMTSAAEAPVSVDAKAIVVTLDSTFIRSCEDGERHLECGFRRCRPAIPRSCRSLFRHDVARLRRPAGDRVLASICWAVNPYRLISDGSGAGCRRSDRCDERCARADREWRRRRSDCR